MRKNPKFWVRVRLGFFGDKGSVCSGSEYFLKSCSCFGSSTVNVGFIFGFDAVRLVSGSSPMKLERCFCGGHLLQINCNYKYQVTD